MSATGWNCVLMCYLSYITWLVSIYQALVGLQLDHLAFEGFPWIKISEDGDLATWV